MLLRVATTGKLDEFMEAEQRRVAKAIQQAVADYADEVKEELRDDVRQSGMVNNARLPTTWQVKHYGQGSRSMEPASLVFSKAPRIIDAFERGVTIRSRSGGMLIVPNSEVWPRGRVTGTKMGGVGRRSDTFAAGVRKFGPLQYVANKSGRGGRFIARGKTNKGAKGGVRKAKPGETADTDIVVFWAVPESRMPKLLSGIAIRARVEREAAGKIAAKAERYLAASAPAP